MAREQVSAQRIGMMATGFLMVTLIGVFASYATPIPPMRGVIAEAAIAKAAASGNPDLMRQALATAKPLLGVAAQKILATLPPDRAGMAQVSTILATETREASALVSYRVRLMVIVIGVLAALFGVALLGIRDSAPTGTIMLEPKP